MFKGLLGWLATAAPQPRTIFAFELKLLHELGLGPDLAKTNLSAEAKRLVQELVERDWAGIAQLKAAQRQILELRQFLHGFIMYHLGKLPVGRSAALKARIERK